MCTARISAGSAREHARARERCYPRAVGPELGVFDQVVRAFALEGTGFGLARGFARLLPTALLVPAFGLRGLPVTVRASMALCLAFAISPALSGAPGAAPEVGGPVVTLLVDALRGLPLALASAVPMWAASMAGGLFDELRGARLEARLPAVADAESPSATLLTLLSGVFFFATGGPASIARALVRAELGHDLLVHTVGTLAAGMTLALVVGGPLVAAGVTVAAAQAVLSRSPFASVRGALPSLRAVTLLAFFAVALERVAALLAMAAERGARG